MGRVASAIAALALLVASTSTSAETLVLRPRYQPGDRYDLSLRVATRTDAATGSTRATRWSEDVVLDYRASVEILDVDESGRPLRERHEDVVLTFERPGEIGSLFEPGTDYEVRRSDGSDVRIFVRGQRVDPKAERVLAAVLEAQFEYSLEPRLLAPAGPVSVGDTWTLDSKLAGRFLRARGVRVLQMAAPATATLERSGDPTSSLVIQYRIPLAWFEWEDMPVKARPSSSEGVFEGSVRVAAAGRAPLVASSTLALQASGVPSRRAGPRWTAATRAVPWSLERTQQSEQRTVPLSAARAGGGIAVSLR